MLWIELTCGIVAFLEYKRRNTESPTSAFEMSSEDRIENTPNGPTLRPERWTKTIFAYYVKL